MHEMPQIQPDRVGTTAASSRLVSRVSFSARLVWSFLIAAFVACAAAACSSTSENADDSKTNLDAGSIDAAKIDGDIGDAAEAPPLHVLFIGDSYTYVNDLPGMLTSIAATSGTSPRITTDEVVQGGASLEDLWEAGAPQKIQEGSWTQVVLQGQSVEPLTSIPGNDQSTFQTYAKQFGDLIVAAGAQPTLFDTWARAAGDTSYSPYPFGDFACPAEMQDELTIAYAQAATLEPKSLLVCAGEAFKEAIAQHPEIILQQSDFSHPTVAGTYLAASTFYVALTGNPVPEQSAVPAGLSATDAATLRDIARVGSNCSQIQLKGAIATSFPQNADGTMSFDFGVAGLPITMPFQLSNSGGATVGIHDALTLAAPFTWTSGAYPGGSDPTFCGDSLAPGSTCTISITYSGASSATGNLTLDFTGDSYLPSATCALHGTATNRAFLTVSDNPGFFSCTDATCSPSYVGTYPGGTGTLDLFVLNHGGAPVTSLAGGTALTSPFAWAGGAFPGGSGSIDYGSPTQTIPYCSGTLGVDEQCVVTVAFSPSALGTYSGDADLAYADASGAVLPNAMRSISGKCGPPLPP
jgi:hypothetical protein